MGKIIISADDFGISSIANKSIIFLSEKGTLDRVAIMIDGLIEKKDIQILKNTRVKLDIHLDAHLKRDFSKGVFFRSFFFLFQILSGKLNSHAVELEWDTQIQKFYQNFGKFPDGLNSHEHTHFFPSHGAIIIRLAEKYRIPYIRFGKRSANIAHPISVILDILRKLQFQKTKKSLKEFETTDLLISADWLKHLDIFSHSKKFSQKDTIEYVFHPERAGEFSFLKKHEK